MILASASPRRRELLGLITDPAVIKHGDYSDGIALHQHKRVYRLVAEQQHVKRVAVVRQRAGNEPVIRGIAAFLLGIQAA